MPLQLCSSWLRGIQSCSQEAWLPLQLCSVEEPPEMEGSGGPGVQLRSSAINEYILFYNDVVVYSAYTDKESIKNDVVVY